MSFISRSVHVIIVKFFFPFVTRPVQWLFVFSVDLTVVAVPARFIWEVLFKLVDFLWVPAISES